MKSLKIVLSFALIAVFFTSCSSNNRDVPISLDELLNTHELWYIDINATKGYGETPFLQKAFTVSFNNGIMYANNNIVGLGDTGNGLGIDIGEYDAYDMVLDVYHDVDGFDTFDVYQIDDDTIELYNPSNDTSYFLEGYQRSEFDYDYVYYDNIHYFLQEYKVWEKTFTSNTGNVNDFDNENYLQFLSGGNDSAFRSSQDTNATNLNNLYWDYTGDYNVGDVANNLYLKTLTLNYDLLGNEYFELNVVNDSKIELYHPNSGTTYTFEGKGYIQFLKTASTKQDVITANTEKKRKPRKVKVDNPRENTRK